jgi:cyclohexanecarboxylate-CoA ligase
VTNALMPIFRERELTFMLGLAESKLLVVPGVFRGFDHAAMARRLQADLPSLRHVLVVGGEGDSAFERLLEDGRPVGALVRPDPNEVVQVVYVLTHGASDGVHVRHDDGALHGREECPAGHLGSGEGG